MPDWGLAPPPPAARIRSSLMLAVTSISSKPLLARSRPAMPLIGRDRLLALLLVPDFKAERRLPPLSLTPRLWEALLASSALLRVYAFKADLDWMFYPMLPVPSIVLRLPDANRLSASLVPARFLFLPEAPRLPPAVPVSPELSWPREPPRPPP